MDYYNHERSDSARAMACWSPVKNLFLGMRGQVMTCCFNKSYVLGNYPQQSLRNIWFGKSRRELTEKLMAYDFSGGCQGCLEAIKARNKSGLTSLKFDHLPLNASEYPTRMDFELTNECNLECVMCRGEFSSAIRRNVEKLPPIPTAYGPELIKELEEFIPHLTDCHFLGGEPFMIPAYIEIWDMIRKLNPALRISIITNATLLSSRVKEIIEPLDCDICVSIDAATKNTYERIRRNARFEQVMNNIYYLRDYTQRKNTRFHLSSCAMRENASEISLLVKLANEINCPIFFTRVTYPRAESLEACSPAELEHVIKLNSPEISPGENEIQKKNRKTLEELLNHLGVWKTRSEQRGTIKASTFDEYLAGLKQHLMTEHREDYPGLFTNIESKLFYLLKVAENRGLRTSAEQKMMEVPYTTLTEMVPGIEKERLVHLFRAYVLPIEI